MIKHIVIESGGYKGLYVLGALDELNKSNFYNIENIETIYGTSIGSYVSRSNADNVEFTSQFYNKASFK